MTTRTSRAKRPALKIFLSHSGLDAKRSVALQGVIEQRFRALAYDVSVFNTSTPEDRFKSFESIVRAGDNWQERSKRYDEELRQYLAHNLQTAGAYLLLVTPKSLAANSRWIEYEINAAADKANLLRRPFFFPCVAHGARLQDLHGKAAYFQGLELDSPGWFQKLSDAVEHGRERRSDKQT